MHDPYLKEEDGYEISQDLEGCIKESDAIVLLTKHNEYLDLKPGYLKEIMNTFVVIDGRNTLNGDEYTENGFAFRGIGKGQYRRKTE